MQATIGVWSPTLLEEKCHYVLSSLLVRMYEYDHRVRIVRCIKQALILSCIQSLSYLTL